MRNHFINYTTVGVFVAAMIVALLWALAQISGRTGPSDSYAIVMDAVTDIDYGTLVRYEGYKIGQVERIEPEWNGKYQFRVFVSVEKDWKFPVDSIARISASSFLAGKTVEVFSGKSTQLVAVGGEIPSGPPADAFSLMAQVAGQIGDLSENSLKPLISHVDEIILKIGNNTDANLEELFASLQAIANEVQNKTPKITDDISTFTTQMNATLLQADKFLDDQNLQSVRAILNNTEKATKDASAAAAEVKALSGKLQNLADQVNDMIGDNRKNVDKSLANLEYILRSVAQNIDSITRNIDGTARNMSEFSRLIRQNPGLLLNGGTPEADQGLTPRLVGGAVIMRQLRPLAPAAAAPRPCRLLRLGAAGAEGAVFPPDRRPARRAGIQEDHRRHRDRAVRRRRRDVGAAAAVHRRRRAQAGAAQLRLLDRRAAADAARPAGDLSEAGRRRRQRGAERAPAGKRLCRSAAPSGGWSNWSAATPAPSSRWNWR